MRVATLDLTRFLAALSVVLYHYISRQSSSAYPVFSELTKFGYLGVPLFFMISGYVIALSANNRSAIQFAISRFVRLYPALWACVILTVIITFLLADKKYSFAQILANFTLLNDYLGFDDIDVVYWTLKAELKFYACVFLLLLFGIFHKYKIWLTIWLLLTALHTATNQPFFMGWFITPAYSSFFIAGMACFLIKTYGSNRFNLFVFSSALLISTIRSFSQTGGFVHDHNTLDKIISVTIVWLFFMFFYLIGREKFSLKESRLLLTLGSLTYPLYLVHNMAGKAIIDSYSQYVPEKILIVTTIVFMVILSIIINKIIERPLATPLKKFLLSKFHKNIY